MYDSQTTKFRWIADSLEAPVGGGTDDGCLVHTEPLSTGRKKFPSEAK